MKSTLETPKIAVIKNGKTVSLSRNLRGIRDYAKRSPVASCVLTEHDNGKGTLEVFYSDLAYSVPIVFGSYKLMLEFVAARKSWKGCELVKISYCNPKLNAVELGTTKN